MNDNQSAFNGWARVEILGHQSHVGYVTTEAYGQAVLFRIDRPEVPEKEEILEISEWIGEQRLPPGTGVTRAKIEAASVLVGSGSIYRIIPCTEEVAMKAIREFERRPLIAVRLPGAKAAVALPLPPTEELEVAYQSANTSRGDLYECDSDVEGGSEDDD